MAGLEIIFFCWSCWLEFLACFTTLSFFISGFPSRCANSAVVGGINSSLMLGLPRLSWTSSVTSCNCLYSSDGSCWRLGLLFYFTVAPLLLDGIGASLFFPVALLDKWLPYLDAVGATPAILPSLWLPVSFGVSPVWDLSNSDRYRWSLLFVSSPWLWWESSPIAEGLFEWSSYLVSPIWSS